MVAQWVNRTGAYAAWGHKDTVLGALCQDGKRRNIRLNESADTFFSHAGRANINGRTRRGFVTTVDGPDGAVDTEFTLFVPAKVVVVRRSEDVLAPTVTIHSATADLEVTRCGLDLRGTDLKWAREEWDARMVAFDGLGLDGATTLAHPCAACD